MICETEAVHAAKLKVIEKARVIVRLPMRDFGWNPLFELAKAMREMDEVCKADAEQITLGIDLGDGNS